MSSLVNYESGDESDDDNKMDESNSIGSPTKRCSLDEKQTNQKMEDEWDNFEKMISDDKSGSQQQGQTTLDPPSLNTISYPSYKQSTDLTRRSLTKDVAGTVATASATTTTTATTATASTSHVKNNVDEKNLKRKFCEERSDKESEKKKVIYDPHDDGEEEEEDDDGGGSSSSGTDGKRSRGSSSSSGRSNQDKCRSTKEREEDKNTHKERKSDKIESGKSTCKEDKDSPPVPDSRKRKISDISKDDNCAKDNKNVKNKSENNDECRQRDGKNKMKRRSRSRSHSKKRRDGHSRSRSRSKEGHHRHHRRHHHSRSSKTRDDSRSSSISPRRRKDRKHRDRRHDGDKHRRHRRSKSRSHSRHRRRRHHSRSSSDSLPRFTRAVIPVKTQTVVIPPKKPSKPTVQPTMKSGTTLPAMFAELQNSDFKEQLKAMFVDAQTKTPDEIAKEIQLDETKLLKAKEKKSALPLNNQNPLAAMVAGGSKATAQQALSQTMAAMHAKVQEITGVAVPKYYNPSAVNPLKYAEQLKKRKMLWSKGKEADAATATAAEKVEKEAEVKPDIKSQLQWSGTSFSADDDGRMAAKFKKLMGIRQDGSSTLPANVDVTKLSEEQRKKQEELFQQLDREYEFARMATHTCRGVGFGFASSHNLPGS